MCENCPDEEIELVKLRFVGGRHVKGRRGPFRSFDTGKVYLMRPTYAELSWWEPVDSETVEQIEVIDPRETTDEEIPSTPSRGLTKAFNVGAPLTDEDFIYGMDDEMLKYFIEGNGGKVDGRWGRNRLIEEAKKLQ
jgi:hypothetical protein